MIESVWIKGVAVLAIVATIFGSGWWVRGTVADNTMLKYKESLVVKKDEQVEATAIVEKKEAVNTAESTARVDTAEITQRVEIQYVDREVIKYRDRPVAGKCVLPVEWVRLYNAAGRPTGSVPAPAAP